MATPKKPTKEQAQIEKLEGHIADLEAQLKEKEDIAIRAQSDYFTLKHDMDAYMKRNEQAQARGKYDATIQVAQKILPSINQLHQTIQNLPAELGENSRVEGVRMVYKNILQTLAGQHIVPIVVEEGMEPDMNIHLPVSTLPTDDESLKGKITQQVEPGYVYEHEDHTQVILPAKVLIGA